MTPAATDHVPPAEPRLVAALERVEREQPLTLAGRALDLACGSGRHALWLAARGMAVDALDREHPAIERLSRQALEAGLDITARVVDLEQPGFELAAGAWSLIVVVNYLHRPLCPQIEGALAPGGVLYYETFTTAQAEFGRPHNPDFLLTPGELRQQFSELEELSYFEGMVPGPAAKAVLLAQRRA